MATLEHHTIVFGFFFFSMRLSFWFSPVIFGVFYLLGHIDRETIQKNKGIGKNGIHT
jgi:hypothetical protein